MDEIFETLENVPKDHQLNILLELLQEKGAALQILRNQSRHTIDPDIVTMIKNKWQECERIKNKIRQLYNENIHELHVQNIAKP